MAVASAGAAAAADPSPYDGAIADRTILGVASGQKLGAATERLAELSAAEALEWIYEPRFMVDFSANCLAQGEDWLFCALVYERPERDMADEIVGVVALSSALSTPDGVRVGMRLVETEPVWGAPSLSFSYDNEAREIIAFPGAPEWIAVRAGSASAGGVEMGFHVGLYPAETSNETYQETSVYRSDAVINSIWVN